MSGGVAHEPAIRVTLDPAPASWSHSAAEHFKTISPEARAFRAELGLPTDRPIIMAGHQLTIWHAGILVKLMAITEAARRTNAASAWLWVDQDEHEFSTIRVPIRGGDSRLRAATWTLADAPAEGLAVASCPSFKPRRFDAGTPALPGVREGIDRIHSALSAHAAESSAARQIAAAVNDLLDPPSRTDHTLFATALARTALFSTLVARMASDPAACIRSYNTAVRAHPESHLTPLNEQHTSGVELPLWIIEPNRPRARVYSTTLARANPASLAPRAILMTGLLRLAGCDLFIHGTGGRHYEAATEQWFRDWLGVALAPMAVATADVPLPLDAPQVTPADVAAAHWSAHRAEHDPRLLHDEPAAAEKQRFMDQITAAKLTHTDPLPHYRAMHAALAEYRARHAEGLSTMHQRAGGLRAANEEAALAADRTWAFPFHDAQSLGMLRQRISSSIADER